MGPNAFRIGSWLRPRVIHALVVACAIVAMLLTVRTARADGLVASQNTYVASRYAQCAFGSTVEETANSFVHTYFPGGICADSGVAAPVPFPQLEGVSGPIPQQDAGCGAGITHPQSMGWRYLVVSARCPEWPPALVILANFTMVMVGVCPSGATMLANGSCLCSVGLAPDGDGKTCVPQVVKDRTRQSLACNQDAWRGNPINLLRGVKRQLVETGLDLAGVPLRLVYDSAKRSPRTLPGTDFLNADSQAFGELWTGTFHKKLTLGAGLAGAQLSRGDGTIVSFTGDGAGAFVSAAGVGDHLVKVAGSYRFHDDASGTMEDYGADGRISRLTQRDGSFVTFFYSDAATAPNIAPAAGYLIEARDQFDRTVKFAYESLPANSTNAKVIGISAPDGETLVIDYERGNLASVRWPDLSERRFHYERPDLPWVLTGQSDEKGVRTSTFAYSSDGRAVATERSGGVDRYSVAFAQPPMVTVSDVFDAGKQVVVRTLDWSASSRASVTVPEGNVVEFGSQLVLGSLRLTDQTQPAGSGCAASSRALAYDRQGNMTQQDDFNGNRICYANDSARNLETSRVEGLAGGAAGAQCPKVVGAGAAIPSGARKITTQWHPDLRLPVRIAEPGRLTTYIYNGQADPFTGVMANCAPTNARLPDGKPIAVLCRRVEQATADADGSKGLTPPLQPAVSPRENAWTYNQSGQVVSHDGPRTDIADITLFAYHGSTAFNGAGAAAVGQTQGDLAWVQGAAGHRTFYTKYNKLGQLLESTDPNGVITSYTYDLRQRLRQVTIDGRTTTYDYWPTGLLKQVTQPDNLAYLAYAYDDAHRLFRVSDNLNNSITYSLDNVGNRYAEEVKDPAGTLRRMLNRSIDPLGRVQQLTGRE